MPPSKNFWNFFWNYLYLNELYFAINFFNEGVKNIFSTIVHKILNLSFYGGLIAPGTIKVRLVFKTFDMLNIKVSIFSI